MEITELIENSLPSMSKGHKAIANYILESYDKAAYMTAARLGEVVGVSESTVVRFTTELGYEGYPEFQRALKEELKSKLTSVQRLDFAEQFSDEGDAVSGIMSQDIQNLKDTLASIDEAEFKKAVNSILNAGKIYIMASGRQHLCRSSCISTLRCFSMMSCLSGAPARMSFLSRYCR